MDHESKSNPGQERPKRLPRRIADGGFPRVVLDQAPRKHVAKDHGERDRERDDPPAVREREDRACEEGGHRSAERHGAHDGHERADRERRCFGEEQAEREPGDEEREQNPHPRGLHVHCP